jgi:hypothetical protein
VDAELPQYDELRRLVRGDQDQNQQLGGLGPDAATWLDEHGWRATFYRWDDIVAPHGRPVATGNPDIGPVLARRLP